MSLTEEPDHRRQDERPADDGAALTSDKILGGPWHAVGGDEVLRAFRSRPVGLSAEEAAARHETFGPNRLHETAARSAAMRLLLQFHNTLIYILIAAAVISVFLGQFVDAAVIIVGGGVNAVIGLSKRGAPSARSMPSVR